MPTPGLRFPFCKSLLATAMVLLSMSARAQYLLVDCSGTTPSAYPSINAALPFAGPGAFIQVTGTCTENVLLYGFTNLTLGAFYGQTAAISGNLTISNSQLVYLYGLAVTNASGDGIDVSSSRSVILDTCTSNGNAGNGLTAGQTSDIAINAIGAFSHNAGYGMWVDGNSNVSLNSWGGTTEISDNHVSALRDQANFSTCGNTHIADSGSAVAIDMRGAGKAQFGSCYGPNVIENNPYGGVSLQETSEISFWTIAGGINANTISNNGPFGIEAGFGSQVTLAGVLITGHKGPGVDIYAHSQLYGTSQIPGLTATQIQSNGNSADPLSAGIRVDGNSEALLRGVNLSQNEGPAILTLVNSSADFAGMTFSGNEGVITCDSTSTMISDSYGNPGSGVRCKAAHTLGNRLVHATTPAVPNIAPLKAMHDRYRQRSIAKK